MNILQKSGYECPSVLCCLSSESIIEIEGFINENHFDWIKNCPEYSSLKDGEKFRLLPGHKTFLKTLPKLVQEFTSNITEKFEECAKNINLNEASFMLKELVKMFTENHNRHPKNRRYSDEMQNLAMYIYMLCGRAGYETISKNLPMPQIQTISKM